MLFSLSSSDKNHSRNIYPYTTPSAHKRNPVYKNTLQQVYESLLIGTCKNRSHLASFPPLKPRKIQVGALARTSTALNTLSTVQKQKFWSCPSKRGQRNQARADTMQCFSGLEQEKPSTLTDGFAPNDALQEDFCETLTGGGTSSFFMNFTS